MHCPYSGGVHDIEVKAADIFKGYVMAPNCEKIWTVLVKSLKMMLVSLPL